ncbi:MAG TPA: PilN domain-containing protein [Candidatus Saccharimonadales bacterium]|nr:PilN domain-containing protein [Candidatus Saccharimonadales bacterium]
MSKVQFNLLPDSKLRINKAQQTKHLVYTISAVVTICSIALLLIMLLVVDGVQKKMMDDAAAKVDNSSKQLQNMDVGKIITVQNQLQTLTGLHQNKHITSRIFSYLPKVTPPGVSINKLDLDLTQNTLNISGTANSQKDVNTFVDSLKQATYKIGDSAAAPAFQQVVESGFNITGQNVGYSIDMQFDAKLFANNLKDSQGNPVTPVISVSGASGNQSGNLFNDGAGSK